MKIGLVLGAGGHPGYPFQVAVLAALERQLAVDLRDTDLIVGTSVGAMTGLLLRAGFSASDLLAIAEGRPASAQADHLLHEVLDPPGQLPPPLPKGRTPGLWGTSPVASLRTLRSAGSRHQRLPAAATALFPTGRACHDVLGHAADSLFAGGWPDRETWVVAMRAKDGERSVFGRETIPTTVGEAVKAASAIPGWFRPTEVDGVRHVDAGVRSTTNADLLVARTDLDLVVVVPPMALDGTRARLLDAPLRWLVNHQLRAEVDALEAAGLRTIVARPSVDVARTMQGDPIRMTPERVQRVLAATTSWAQGWATTHLPVPA